MAVLRGRCDRTIIVLQLPVQFMPITTKVVSSNPVHGEKYSIQHNVIEFVSDLRQVVGFLRVLRFPPPIKLINQTKPVSKVSKWNNCDILIQYLFKIMILWSVLKNKLELVLLIIQLIHNGKCPTGIIWGFGPYVAVEHVLPPKNVISSMGFDPGTSRIVRHRSTNWAKGDFH